MIIYRGPSGHHISQQKWRTISASTIQHSRPPLHILEEHHSTTNLSPRVFANTERMDLALGSYDLQQHLRTLRMAVLVEWSQYPTSHDVHRNALAHGNILADMRTIAFMEEWNTDRAERWKSVFAEYYGGDYQVCVDRNIQLSNSELLDIFNMNASIKASYKWRTRARKADREEIQAKCASTINEWKRGTEDIFQERSETLTNYRQAMQLYYKY